MKYEGPKATENPACLLCESDKAATVGTKARFGMPVTNVCCERCALVYVTPRPNSEQMAEYYKSLYREHYGSVGYTKENGEKVVKGHPDYEAEMNRWHRTQVGNTAQLAELKEGQKVLEIGCRHGRTLSFQRERFGIEGYGIEPGEAEAQQANESGIQCFCGTLEDYDPGDVRFDQIQLFHVLEHFHEPLDALNRMRSLLKPEGRVIIEVPNVYQPYGLLEENFFQNVHLVSFSPHTLHAMLLRAGFKVDKLASGTTLYCAASVDPKLEQQELPLAFTEKQLGSAEHTCRWVVERLESYKELEKCRWVLKHREPDARLVRHLTEMLRRPCFPEHLAAVVSDLATHFVHGGRAEIAHMIATAATLGPHPQELIVGFAKLANTIMGTPGPTPQATVSEG